MFQVFIVATVLVALAELGDKTQMLSLVLASRYPSRQVFAGVLAAVLALQLIAVTAGGLVGSLLPGGLLTGVTAVLFIGFGVWSFIDASRVGGDEEVSAGRRGRVSVVALVAGAFFMAELGDKTQVLTLAIAADPGAAARTLSLIGLGASPAASGISTYVGVWLGSTVGMMLVNGVAIVVGSALGARLPRSVIARVSGVVFIVFGVLVALAYLLRQA